MNKAKVNAYLPRAIEALTKFGIATENGVIVKTYRANISSFGAAITMGSFKAAVAFFAKDADSANQNRKEKVNRSLLICAMNYVVNGSVKSADTICKDIILMNNADIPALCEEYINASIALKLAMNGFDLIAA